MENANLGKRLLYTFAGAIFGPAVVAVAVTHFINNPPLWFWWSLLVVMVGCAWFGYRFPSRFEETFAEGLKKAAPLTTSPTSTLSLQNTDMQRKLPVGLGWFFFLLFLFCLILLFTRFINIVPYIFGGGFVIFLILMNIFYNKNKGK